MPGLTSPSYARIDQKHAASLPTITSDFLTTSQDSDTAKRHCQDASLTQPKGMSRFTLPTSPLMPKN
ncbi:hypothetical protein Trco_004199 [Trichoderma cornu-damae]|uniref:Uncharacterized protein n=1 Tax=Trichoderma cornu-damae TaxID=654480 RepID=A0A9P8QK92_9HYPO|nr:hypothetical protein Trco_004199 [Trichoderma cornu-damae]